MERRYDGYHSQYGPNLPVEEGQPRAKQPPSASKPKRASPAATPKPPSRLKGSQRRIPRARARHAGL